MMVWSVQFQSFNIVLGQLVSSLCNTHFSCFTSAWEFFYDYAFSFYLYPYWRFSLTGRIQAKTSNSQLSTFSRWFIFSVFSFTALLCVCFILLLYLHLDRNLITACSLSSFELPFQPKCSKSLRLDYVINLKFFWILHKRQQIFPPKYIGDIRFWILF